MLAAISTELRALIERVAGRVVLEPGATLFTQGEPADVFFVVDDGEIEISALSAEGRKLTLDIMTPGEIFGEIGLFAGRRTATATALGRTRLRRARRADLLAALRDEPEPDLALEIIELLCARLREVSDKLEERAFLPLPIRLARRVIRLDEKLGGVVPVSQADLADFVGATREAVAKVLADWRRRGWITVTRGGLRLVDRAALASLAAGDAI